MSQGFSPAQIARLNDKLDASFVKSRSQSGQTLSYIEGWRVIDLLNEILGFDGYSVETLEMRQTVADSYTSPRGDEMVRVGYLARVRLTVYAGERVLIREGVGHGQAAMKDPTLAHESGAKEAATDALKRAAITLGMPLGLGLYDKDRTEVGTPDHVIAEEVRKEVSVISPAQVEELRNLLAATSSDPARFAEVFKLSSLEAITEAQFPALKKALLDKREKMAAAAKKGAA